jgi:predicted DNA-binding transcriptional regulator AlpA
MDYADPILRRKLLELGIDIDLIPALLRKAQIVSDPGKPAGLLPIGTATFNKNVADGLIAKPVRIGARAVAWRRHDIVRIMIEGTVLPRRRRSPQPADQHENIRLMRGYQEREP